MRDVLINEYALLTSRADVLRTQAETLPDPKVTSGPTLSGIATTDRLIQSLQKLCSTTDETKYENDPQYRSDICAKEDAIIVGRINLLDELVGDGDTAHTFVLDEYCSLSATIDTLHLIRELYEI
jgi:hypothetical protein